jgi:hypothetical protein
LGFLPPGTTVTDEAAFDFGLADAALLRVVPRRSSEVYRSFIGLRWDMVLCFSFRWRAGRAVERDGRDRP